MTEDDLKKIIAQGKEADDWLNHPCFKHVITMIKADYIRAFEKTKFKDKDEREEIWRKMQALDSITKRMERMIRDANNANKTLLERMRDKFR